MNKLIIATLLACTVPMAAMAQDAAKPAAKHTAKTTAKTTAKAAPAKTVAKTAAKPATKVADKRTHRKVPAKLTRSAAKAVEEVTPIDTDPDIALTPEDLEVANKVYTGLIKCELGESVQVTADDKHPGFFTVQILRNRYRMHPVASRTGAVRLEDPRAGAMWLQLGNKSMLMNQKIGERMADECQSPQQTAMAEEILKHPPRSLFESADAPAPSKN